MTGLAPASLLIFLIATSCALLAHVLLGRRWRQMLLFWVAALVGCLLAYGLQLRLPLDLPAPANVPILESVLLAWLLLFVVARLRV
ncbi:MAG: hypothetical protein HC822_09735 [Oscillochloris sp.]|nr:hypothetical protein [Oscillochloris sp.]